MGSCISSARSKGVNSRLSNDGKDLSNSSSKVSSASVPHTPRTEGETLQSSNVKSFAFSELKTATRNFRPDYVTGECRVFKAWIDEHTFTAAKPGTGMVVTVKRLNQERLQGHKEWLAEINYLGQLYHPNLVKLIGYCLEDDRRFLVCEFMPQGSLEDHLFRRAFQPLSWNLRMKVALGAAKNFNAKFSDFGLAKDGPLDDDESHVYGYDPDYFAPWAWNKDNGYAAPEYVVTGDLTANSNVYSFGVVLLEMLTGRRAVDKNCPPGEHRLVEWAKPYMDSKRKILRVMDPRIEGQYSVGGALRAANIAIKCLATEPKLRPNMNEVVKALEQLQDLKDEESPA